MIRRCQEVEGGRCLYTSSSADDGDGPPRVVVGVRPWTEANGHVFYTMQWKGYARYGFRRSILCIAGQTSLEGGVGKIRP